MKAVSNVYLLQKDPKDTLVLLVLVYTFIYYSGAKNNIAAKESVV